MAGMCFSIERHIQLHIARNYVYAHINQIGIHPASQSAGFQNGVPSVEPRNSVVRNSTKPKCRLSKPWIPCFTEYFTKCMYALVVQLWTILNNRFIVFRLTSKDLCLAILDWSLTAMNWPCRLQISVFLCRRWKRLMCLPFCPRSWTNLETCRRSEQPEEATKKLELQEAARLNPIVAFADAVATSS